MGPIIKNVRATVTKHVTRGTVNILMASGMYFAYKRSNHAAKATAQITGKTEPV